ncbi:MAG: hypothetical protein HN891_00765 [Planctomycetes bacterium]|nr:hypothetical protein [Planctomycetota bacterium]
MKPTKHSPPGMERRMVRFTTVARGHQCSSPKLVSDKRSLVLLPLLLLLLTSSVSAQNFIRGDANGDGDIDFYVGDAVEIFTQLFTGCWGIACDDAADSNDDGNLDISDAVNILAQRQSGLPLPLPFPIVGNDPTPDGLLCATPTPSFAGYTFNPAFQLDVIPVGVGSGSVGTIFTAELQLTVPAGFGVTGISFGVCHDPAELDLLPGIAYGPLAPDYFQVQGHSTGFNCNSIPTFILPGSLFGPGVHVIAEAQYQILTSGGAAISFCSMTGQMPVPMALAAVDFGAMTDCSDVFAPASVGANINSAPEFVRGDTNASGGSPDIADAINSLYYIFNIPGGISPCDDASDVNDDGIHPSIADAIYLLNYLFPPPSSPPPAPFPACGPDPTTDPLGCASFPPC